MTGHAGEALELALALLRMPAQRLALRERPLPADIDRILPIAAGSRDALAAAAQATGEPGPLILEAVQFYLQEILFFPDADAYRILGVPHDADVDRIQQHHRQLQRWVHPDRRGNDLASGFASRVNQAWNELRNDERRQAYDAMLQQQPLSTPGNPSTAPAAAMGWHRIDAGSHARWRQALPLTVLAIVCVLLLLLMTRQPEQATFQKWQDEAQATAAELTDSDAAPVDVPAAASRPIQARSSLPSVQHAQGRAQPTIARTEDGMQPSEASAVDTQPSTLATLVPMAGAQAAGQALEQTTEQPFEPTGPSIDNVSAMPAQTSSVASVPGDQARQTIVDTAKVPREPAAAAPPARASRVRTPPPAPQVPATATLMQPLVVAQPPTSRELTPTGASMAGGTPDLVERVRLARQRAREVTAYISDPQARTPPVWNDLDTQQHAEGLRRDFQAAGVNKRLALQRPDWRISRDDARLEAAYRCSGRCSDGDHGVLRMQLGWRNGMWLVRELEMERAP